MKWPRIRSRRTTAVSPWVSLIAREVEFSRGAAPQIYHAIEQADYISVVALTRAGKIPIVRQYRPTLEAYTWELPAGLVEPGEDPAEGCRRELLEENAFQPEPGISVKLVSPAEIVRLIRSGVFVSQLHIGALMLAELNGFLALPRKARPVRSRK